MNDSVEFRHLLYFRAVAEAGSFTRAAAIIGLRQPTLSQQIKQLEDELGAPLFHRARRMCRLTPAGEMLLPYARRVLGEMENLRHSLDDLSGLRRGSLTVAALPVLSHRVMPLAVARFHAEHPDIRVRMLEMSVDDMEAALVQGTVEMGIGYMPPAGKSLRAQLLFQEELVAVVREDDPLAQGGGGGGGKAARGGRERGDTSRWVSMEALMRRPLIALPPGHGTRTMMLNAFASVRRVARFAMEAGSVEVLLQVVRECGGPGIVPSSALWGRTGNELAGCAVLRVERPGLRRQVGFLNLSGVHTRPAAEAFIPIVQAVVEKELQG
ncbi:LysR family transcriptional regulator [Geminisphaera colitermitum]|uniref:LysR family transcriptional regulator n=1 Tax=Geminisphaera colitermitum TaxID=1148786 RepID=UPI0022B7F13A|nr:LysR substrate-binding domain-containing protein [Geminisphaera colitermitum]